MKSEVITKPFRESHADIFAPADDYAADFRATMPQLILLGKHDQCGVHMLDGRILYIGGWCESAPGVAEVFIFPSIYARQFPKSFYEHVKWWVHYLKHSYRRVQTWGEDTELSRRWLSALGFQLEGTLSNYTVEGKSMLIWGIY